MLTCANFTNPAHWEEQLQRVIAAVRGELRLAEVGSPPEELLEQRPVEFRPTAQTTSPARMFRSSRRGRIRDRFLTLPATCCTVSP
jgi:hypothetical protein